MRKVNFSQIIDALLPVFATFAALAVGAVMLLILGANPVRAYGALLEGAFGSGNALAETAVKAVPLLLVGLGICIAFRANVINIGGEGQMIIGAILATLVGLSLSGSAGWVVIPLAMVVGAIGKAEENGVLWFGTQASQTSLAPDIVVANQIYDWAVVLNDIIGQIEEGNYGGKAYVITLENNGEFIEYNPDFDLPADVKTLAEDTVKGIIDGSITIPIGE